MKKVLRETKLKAEHITTIFSKSLKGDAQVNGMKREQIPEISGVKTDQT